MAQECEFSFCSNNEKLETWFEMRPRDVSIALAARAILRLIPLAITNVPLRETEASEQRFKNFMLSLFRSASLASIAVACLPPVKALRAAVRAARSIHDVITSAAGGAVGVALSDSDDIAVRAAIAVAYAGKGAHAIRALGEVADIVAAAKAGKTRSHARAANRAADAMFAAIWAAVDADARFIDSGGTALQLADRSLWPFRTPICASQYWKRLKYVLTQRDESWDVWIEWYEDRITGCPQGRKYASVISTVPLNKWQEGPTTVNGWIKEQLCR